MDKSQIEALFNNLKYSQTLEALNAQTIQSHWIDTVKLRCLRAMGKRKDAIEFANQLHQHVKKSTSPYTLTESQCDEQLRYIALVFAEFDDAKQACDIMESLCQKDPNNAALIREYAFALSNDDKLDDAETQLLASLNLQPSNASTHAQLARIYCRSGRVSEGYNSYSRAASLEPKNPNYLQRLIYWSNYLDRTTQRSNFQLTQLWREKVFPSNQSGTNTWRTADPDKVLKVAFVSSDFCAHAVSFFIKPLLKGLRSDNTIKVTAYSNTHNPDKITEEIKAQCDVWRDSSKLNDKALAAQISADQIDILIDLNGHTASNRLSIFAKHIAPIQMNWLGYPSTTGLKSIAHRITDEVADPTNLNDKFYSEELIRLPNGFLCYEPHENAPSIKPTKPENKEIRFGSFNNLAKISSQTFDIWAAALQAAPNSTMYLKRQQLIHNNARQHVINEFKQRGIDESRLILKTSKAKIEQHLNEYNSIDIALDTTPYNGTTTTLEALWMGVPVITLTGNTHASRVSASILTRLNLSGLICKNSREFAAKAKELSDNPKTLTKLRKDMRKVMSKSAVMDEDQFSSEFSQALRQTWQDWCTKRNTEEGLQASPSSFILGEAK